MAKNTKLIFKITPFDFTIFINGILHLSISRTGLFAVQSWVSSGMYKIEYYHKSGNVVTEYDREDIFKQVLTKINNTLGFIDE